MESMSSQDSQDCQFPSSLPFFSSVVQLLSRVRLFATPWIAARQASLSITISWSSLKLKSIKSVMPSSHLILCCPLLLPPVPPSPSNESTLRMRWPKYWSFSFSIIPSKEHPGLISFRMDWSFLSHQHNILVLTLSSSELLCAVGPLEFWVHEALPTWHAHRGQEWQTRTVYSSAHLHEQWLYF